MACERICFGFAKRFFIFLIKFFSYLIFFFNSTFTYLINLNENHFKKQLKKTILDVNEYHFKIRILMYVLPLILLEKVDFFEDLFLIDVIFIRWLCLFLFLLYIIGVIFILI
jgi:hypothetical protein